MENHRARQEVLRHYNQGRFSHLSCKSHLTHDDLDTIDDPVMIAMLNFLEPSPDRPALEDPETAFYLAAGFVLDRLCLAADRRPARSTRAKQPVQPEPITISTDETSCESYLNGYRLNRPTTGFASIPTNATGQDFDRVVDMRRAS